MAENQIGTKAPVTLTSASQIPPEPKAPPISGCVPANDSTDLLLDNTIVARPLGNADVTRIKSKNPNLAFQWVNRLFQNGQRISEHEFEGFRKATPADCEVPGLSSVDGGFVYGDLILMKHDKATYRGALRHVALKSLAATRPKEVQKILDSDTEFRSSVNRSGGKIRSYTPNAGELKEVLGD